MIRRGAHGCRRGRTRGGYEPCGVGDQSVRAERLELSRLRAQVRRDERQAGARALDQPRGKVLGGSSSLNAMAYVRGHPCDYDRWHAEILAGDALLYKNCIPGSAMRNYFTLLAFGISTLNADRARPHDGTSCPCLAGRPPRSNRRRGLLLDDEGLPEKRAHSVRGLRALRQPRLDGGGVEVRLLFDRVVPSELLLVKKREGEAWR